MLKKFTDNKGQFSSLPEWIKFFENDIRGGQEDLQKELKEREKEILAQQE